MEDSSRRIDAVRENERVAHSLKEQLPHAPLTWPNSTPCVSACKWKTYGRDFPVGAARTLYRRFGHYDRGKNKLNTNDVHKALAHEV